MNKGFLHFDVSDGCSAESLIGALKDLGAPQDGVERNLELAQGGLELPPVVGALVENVMGELGPEIPQPPLVKGAIVAFASLLYALDPLEVTATRVPVAWPPGRAFDRGQLLGLLTHVPSFEAEWPGPYSEPVGVALLKSCVSRFGVRGESTVLKMGRGRSQTLETRALWCEPKQIATRVVQGPSLGLNVKPLVQVQAVLAHTADLDDIKKQLQGLAARSVTVAQVTPESVRPGLLLTACLAGADSQKAIEILLAIGGASEVYAHPVEHHALHKRVVSVPLGRSQKLMFCRVSEWVLGDKILRAEPEANDLAALAERMGTGPDVARSDVQSAWKKWRGRN